MICHDAVKGGLLERNRCDVRGAMNMTAKKGQGRDGEERAVATTRCCLHKLAVVAI